MTPQAIWEALTTRPLPQGEDTKWNLYKVFPARASILSNVSRRFERGVRLGLGGALIYVLTMIDTAALDYSFRYVGPFIYWVVATLTPPFLSTVPLLIFAGMFCIVVACCMVSVLVAFMTLGNPTGRILTVVFYAFFLAWGLGLNVGKKKELTIIGSYILTYVMPLAALIALPYATGGVTIPVPPAVLKNVAIALDNATPQTYQLVVKAIANEFRLDPAYVERNVNNLFSDPLMVNMVIRHLNDELQISIPFYPLTQKLDPLNVIKQLTYIFVSFLEPDKYIRIPLRFNNLRHLGELSWIKAAHCTIEGSFREGFTVKVETGLWLLRALWTAHGQIGFLRNLLAFAALGFAIWMLVMIIPPIHRQRDVVRRNLANCTVNINRCNVDFNAPRVACFLKMYTSAYNSCLRATREVLHCLEGALGGGVRSAGSSQISGHSPQRGEANRLNVSSPGGLARSSSALRGESGGVPGGRRYPSDGANRDISLAVPVKRSAGSRKRGPVKPLSPRVGGRPGTLVEVSPRTAGERLAGSNSSYLRAYTYSSAKFQDALVPLKQSVIEITDDQKRVFLSGMEPYLFSGGPMVFVVNEVEEVRGRMLQCAAYVQQLCRVLFDVVRTSIVNAEFGIWSETVSMIEAIIAKAEESYQTCGELIMMQPPLLFRTEHWKAVEAKIRLLDRLELELQELHGRVSYLANEATDKVFNDFGRSSLSSSNQDYSNTLATGIDSKSATDSEACAAVSPVIATVPEHESSPAIPQPEANRHNSRMEEAVSGDGAQPPRAVEDEDEKGQGLQRSPARVSAGTIPLPRPRVERACLQTPLSNDPFTASANGAAERAGRRRPGVPKKEEREALLQCERGGEAVKDGQPGVKLSHGRRRESFSYGLRAPETREPKVRIWGLASDPSREPPLEHQTHDHPSRTVGGGAHRTHSGGGLLREDAGPLFAGTGSFRRASGRSWASPGHRAGMEGRARPNAGDVRKMVASPAGPPSSLDQNEARNVCRTMDHMSLSMALIAKYHAAFKEPVALAKAVKALQAAQRKSTLKGLCMNIVFPLLPMLIHGARLTVTPAKQLLFWRLRWSGPTAWWRDPEAWYLFKFFIPMLTLFSFAVFFKELSQYTWGQKLTENPSVIDFCTQGITTRMVPWIMLGFLTCFQTTYNGTVFRGVNRIIGIVCGSFAAWVVMRTCNTHIAKIVCFSCCLLGLDIFITADPKNPNYGFHPVWGYAGMVFTYTQALIVGLAFEDLGGITGSRDYLTVTRIVSSILGVVLAIVVAHLPPACSGNNAAAMRYGEALECCSRAVEKAVQYLLESSERGASEGHGAHKHLSDHTANTRSSLDSISGAKSGGAGEESSGKADGSAAGAEKVPTHLAPVTEDERLSSNNKGAAEVFSEEGSARKGRACSEVCSVGAAPKLEAVHSYLEQARAEVQGEAAEKLQDGQRLYKEGCSTLFLFPWRTISVLEEIYLTLGTMRKRVEDMCDLLRDFMTEGYKVDDHTLGITDPQTNGSQGSVEAMSGAEVPSDKTPRLADSQSKRKGSLFVLKEGNAAAVMELFGTRSGARFRTEMAAAVRAVTELSSAVSTELKLLLPTTVDRLMSFFFIAWPRSKVYAALPDAVHEQCRSNVETAFSHLMITLSNCLAEHRAVFEQNAARRRAAAFTIMALIYYLDMHRRALDCVHESLVACRDSPTYWGWLGNCLKPNIKGLGVD